MLDLIRSGIKEDEVGRRESGGLLAGYGHGSDGRRCPSRLGSDKEVD